jgi:Ca-activated chloride channel homolog
MRTYLRRSMGAIATAALFTLTSCSSGGSGESAVDTRGNPSETLVSPPAATNDATEQRDATEQQDATEQTASEPSEDAAAETSVAAAAGDLNEGDSRQGQPVRPVEPETARSGAAETDSKEWDRAPEAPARQAPPEVPTPTTPPDITARDSGVNADILTRDDAESTFAMDVDTGSYTLARSLVEQGQLPPIDAVRAEEFVNSFDQQYQSPEPGKTFAIHVDGTPAPFLAANKRIVRVGVQGRRVDAADRKPVRLTFVIDTSGSMAEGGKLETVVASLDALLSQLGPDDQVAVVRFSNQSQVVLEPTIATRTSEIREALRSLRPDGSTNAEAGLRLGYSVAQRMFTSTATNRVVLLSDGVANVGPNGPEAILAEIGEWSRRDIDLNTIGVGTATYNDEMMEQLADNGNGFYAYIDNQAAAEKLFVEKFVSTVETIARDAKIQVAFNEDRVVSYRLLGFENRAIADRDFRNDKVDAGEIGAGHSVTALYEVTLTDKAADGRSEGLLAEVRLRWKEPTGDTKEAKRALRVEDLSSDFASSDAHLRLDVVVTAYAEVLRQGSWSRFIDLEAVSVNARRLADGPFANSVDVQDLARLTEQALKIKNRTW